MSYGEIIAKFKEMYPNRSDEFYNRSLASCFSINFTKSFNENQMQIYFNFYRYFVSWFVPLLIVFGELGTLLCLIVLLRRRTGTTETRMWFIALSLSDMYSLAVGLLIFYSSKANIIFPWLQSSDPRNYSKFNCYLINSMVFFGLFVSTWIQVGISVLRVMSVRKSQILSTKPRLSYYSGALASCILICLFLTVLMITLSLEYSYVTPCMYEKICRLKHDRQTSFFYFSSLIKVILPTIALLACSIIIINHLNKFRRRFSDRNTLTVSCPTTLGSNSTNPNTNLNYPVTSTMRKRLKQKQISYTLLGMNLTFFLLTLPFDVYKITIFHQKPDQNHFTVLRILDKCLNILMYTNNATNWLFYFMLGQRFRKNVVDLVCKTKWRCRNNWDFIGGLRRRWRNSLRKNNNNISRRNTTKSTKLPGIFHRHRDGALPQEYNLNYQQQAVGLLPQNLPPQQQDMISVNSSGIASPPQPKFNCSYPGQPNDFFPKFY